MVRVVRDVIDDIINKSKTEGVTANELLDLFAEAYNLVSSEDNIGRAQIQQIEARIKSVVKERKDLFGGDNNENRNNLYEMRDNKGRKSQADDVVITHETENAISDEEKKSKLKEFAEHRNNLKGGKYFALLHLQDSDYESALGLWDVDQPVLDEIMHPADKNKKAQYQAEYGFWCADIAELVSEYRKYEESPQEYDRANGGTDSTDNAVVNEPKDEITLRSVWEDDSAIYYDSKKDEFHNYHEILSEADLEKAEQFIEDATDPRVMYERDPDRIKELEEKYGENYAVIARLVATYHQKLEEKKNDNVNNNGNSGNQSRVENNDELDGDSEFSSLKDEIKKYASGWVGENLDTGKVIDGNTFTDDEIEAVATLYLVMGAEYIRESLDKVRKGEEVDELKEYSNETAEKLLLLADSFAYDKDWRAEDNVFDAIDELSQNNADNREVYEIIGTLGSLDELEKLDFISNKIDQKTAREAIDSDKPNEALANVADLLMAHHYFGRDIENFAQKDVDILDSVTIEQLNAILSDPSHINPSNAAAYRLLCEKCNDSTLRAQVLDAIAKSLKEYDNENFGPNPDAEKLNEDYMKLQLRAAKINPLEFEAEENQPSLKDTIILGDDGNALSDVDAEEKKKALAELAKEIAIQNLLRRGDDNIDDDALKNEIKAVTNGILFGSNGKVQGGKFVTTISGLSTSVACIQGEAEKFKDRVLQKFKNTPFAKSVTDKINALDERLSKKYGKRYEDAKGIVKGVGNFCVGVAKGSVMFAAAGLVPGGTAVLMGYNIYKSWKGIAPELKKKDVSLAKKVALVAGTAITSTISMAAMSMGLDVGAENLTGVSEGLSSMMDSAGNMLGKVTSQIASLGGTICSPEAISSALSSMGGVTRMGVIAASATLPEMVENIGLRIKRGRVNRKIKKTPQNDPEYKQLLDVRSSINKVLVENRIKAAKKAGAVAAGMGLANLISGPLNAAAQDCVDKAGTMIEDVRVADDVAERTDSLIRNNVMQNDSTEVNNVRTEAGNVMQNDSTEVNNVHTEAGAKVEAGTEVKAEAEAGTETGNVVTEAEAKNIDEAKVAGSSGLGGKSSYDHTLQHLESLGDSRITNSAEMAENLCKHFGGEANKVTIACKMAPYALQDVLGLELPESVDPTSYQMLDYMADHPLTDDQMAKLNQFLDKNFDGVRFRTENFPDWDVKQQSQNVVGNTSSAENGSSSPDAAKVDAEQTSVGVEVGEGGINVNVNATGGSSVSVGVDTKDTDVNVKVNGDGARYSWEEGYDEEPEVSDTTVVPVEQDEIDKFMDKELATEDDRRRFVIRGEDGKIDTKAVFVPGNENIDGPRTEVSFTIEEKNGHMVFTREYNDGSTFKITSFESSRDNFSWSDDVVKVTEAGSVVTTAYKDGTSMIYDLDSKTTLYMDSDGKVSNTPPDSIDVTPKGIKVTGSDIGNDATAARTGGDNTNPNANTDKVDAKGTDVDTRVSASTGDVRVNVTVNQEPPAQTQTPAPVQTHTQSPVNDVAVDNRAYVPAYDMTNPYQYAEANGLVPDSRLSNGLDRIGDGMNFDGYAGAFYDVNNPNRIVILTNDMVTDQQHMAVMTRQEAEYWQAQNGRMYSHHTHDHHSGFDLCPDRKVDYGYRSCGRGHVGYYSDGGSRFWNTMAKIDAGVHIASDIVRDVAHFTNMIGGNHR